MEKSLPEQKSEFRKTFRERRLAIPADQRLEWDKAIACRVLDLKALVDANRVFTYLSRNGEVDTKFLVHEFFQLKKRVYTPSPDIRALPHDGLFSVTPKPEQEGHFPPALCKETHIAQLDIVLVPGIVWDRSGYRIGFGGGYFDRLLSMTRNDCTSVGLAYQCQLVDGLPREPWDQQVHFLVTENQVYTCR